MIKKRSFLKVLNFKRKIRYLTIFSTVILLVVMVQFLINNPGKSQAYSWDAVNKIFTVRSGGEGFFSDSRFVCQGSCANIDLSQADVTIDGDINGNGWIDPGEGFEIVAEGTNHFKSLTIKNSAALTHAALTISDFDVNNPETLYASGQKKKVDIEVDGDIVLQSWGKIDVSGKGYPGSSGQNGFGPGAGNGAGTCPCPYNERSNCNGSGAGYIGIGGAGDTQYGEVGGEFDSGVPGGLTYENIDFAFGSSGGAACADNSSNCSYGAAGGGRIKLVSDKFLIKDSFSHVSANGNSVLLKAVYERTHGKVEAYGGGGSGGSVWIKANELEFAYNASSLASASLGMYLAGDGTVLKNINAYNVYANGGNTYIIDEAAGGGGGGGGRVTVIKNETPYGINKILTPIDRNGTDSNFNPYMIQKGDRVRVDLKISKLKANNPTVIEDELIKNESDNLVCQPIAGNMGGGTVSGDSIVWNIIPTSSNETLTYDCLVQ